MPQLWQRALFTHTRLRARDHYTSSTLIGGKGGAGPSSFCTTLEGPTEWVCECKMFIGGSIVVYDVMSFRGCQRSYIVFWRGTILGEVSYCSQTKPYLMPLTCSSCNITHTSLRARDHYLFKYSHWWKGQSWSKFASHYAWRTNRVSMWMQDGCEVYMDSYIASNESCFMVIWTIFKNHLLEVGLTQTWETIALQTLTTVDVFYYIMHKDPRE